MERGFRKYGFAGQQRVRDPGGDADGPLVVRVRPIAERHQKARIGDPLHEGEKPLRRERSGDFRTAPASRMKGRVEPPARAFSS